MAEPPKQTYFCRSCNATFFSYSDMIEHKGKTGHPEYRVLTKWTEA
jgi:hypothetical protein